MKTVEFDGYMFDPTSINFVGKAEYSSRDSSYGFVIVVNGSEQFVGRSKKKDETESIRDGFLKIWKDSVTQKI